MEILFSKCIAASTAGRGWRWVFFAVGGGGGGVHIFGRRSDQMGFEDFYNPDPKCNTLTKGLNMNGLPGLLTLILDSL